MTNHQYGISALIPQTSFRNETSDGFTECPLFSQGQLRAHWSKMWEISILLIELMITAIDWEQAPSQLYFMIPASLVKQ